VWLARVEGRLGRLMRGHRAIIDLQWQSVLSHRVQPSQDHNKSAVIAAASSLCLQAGSPPPNECWQPSWVSVTIDGDPKGAHALQTCGAHDNQRVPELLTTVFDKLVPDRA
jgi:hypothetical protein